MKSRRTVSFIVISGLAAASVVALGLFAAAPAQASGGWGFGISVSPGVVASCTDYNLVPARVDIPEGAYAGYVSGRLTNLRTGTSRRPIYAPDQVTNIGMPTVAYMVFNPPAGSAVGDVFHVTMTLSSSPAMTPVVGTFEFNYRCLTGEIVRPNVITPINLGYGDLYVGLANGKDEFGNPDVEIWCNDPEGWTSFLNMSITKAVLASIPAQPNVNTIIDKNTNCLVRVSAYVLTSGEVQVTIGPDPYGVVAETFFTGLPPTNINFFRFNVNQGIVFP